MASVNRSGQRGHGLLPVTAQGARERLTRWVRPSSPAHIADRVLARLAARPEGVAPRDGPHRERMQAALVLPAGGDRQRRQAALVLPAGGDRQRFQDMMRLSGQDWWDALVTADPGNED